MVLRKYAIDLDPVKSKKRPTRPLYAINQAWRESVKARMDAMGMNIADLSKAVGFSPSMGSQLLDDKAKAKSSKWVPKIHEVLGLPPPQEAQAMTASQVRWNQLYERLDERDREHMLGIVEALAARASSKQ
jgi:hypothetical protein